MRRRVVLRRRQRRRAHGRRQRRRRRRKPSGSSGGSSRGSGSSSGGGPPRVVGHEREHLARRQLGRVLLDVARVVLEPELDEPVGRVGPACRGGKRARRQWTDSSVSLRPTKERARAADERRAAGTGEGTYSSAGAAGPRAGSLAAAPPRRRPRSRRPRSRLRRAGASRPTAAGGGTVAGRARGRERSRASRGPFRLRGRGHDGRVGGRSQWEGRARWHEAKARGWGKDRPLANSRNSIVPAASQSRAEPSKPSARPSFSEQASWQRQRGSEDAPSTRPSGPASSRLMPRRTGRHSRRSSASSLSVVWAGRRETYRRGWCCEVGQTGGRRERSEGVSLRLGEEARNEMAGQGGQGGPARGC